MDYTEKKKMRPVFPKRAVVTAGMPYGNKELHFGHIGGVFVQADTFARFLRDRIGEENVIFVSGTDCYGSPILESYRKAKEAGTFTGTIEEYVTKNHLAQKKTLDNYEISPNLYGASALGRASEIHKVVSKEVFEGLYKAGCLEKLSTPQFYDPKFKVLLNGRQVIGKCPIQGCQSEKGYADECDLGHQYMPSELIDPHSTLSGLTPEVRDVTNWYFKLENCIESMQAYVSDLRQNSNARKIVMNTIEEFLKAPCIYVQKKFVEDLDALCAKFPKHEVIDDNKNSYTFVFDNLDDREAARKVLANLDINCRTGKTLVPFRLSGNIEWGVPLPDTEDQKDLTFWVWPESLWAPISFTRTYLESKGAGPDEWKNYWNSDDATVYQFIGQDNIYFYGIAQMAMWEALGLKKTFLVPNYHVLFMNKKASSSGAVKPPMAQDLLDFYTAEQMRMHFLSLGLANKSVSFDPQAYLPEEEKNGADPVLKDGNLLTNVYNRIIRSCFYTMQKYFDGKYPANVSVSESIIEESKEAILTYEQNMYDHQFHKITYVLDTYLRNLNKYWVNNMRTADANDDNALRAQVLVDTFYAVRVAAMLIHPIAPTGCEKLREYLNVDKRIFNWDFAFEPLTFFMEDANTHEFKFLEPRVDFFEMHESQLAAKEQQ